MLASLVSIGSIVQLSNAFVTPGILPTTVQKKTLVQPLFSSTKEKEETKSEADTHQNSPEAKSGDFTPDPNAEGLPWWWELVWKLDIMQKGEPGEPIKFGDSANVLRTNIEQIYGGYPSLDGCPLAGM